MHNVLIIGMGGIAYAYDEKLSSKFCYSHYKAFKNNKFFKVIGCVENDLSRKNYLKNKTNIQIYKSINFVPKKLKIDIVVISTPTKNHLISVKKCIKQIKPKIILCEKPMADKIIDAKKIVALCKKNKIKLFVNYLRISDPGAIKIKEIVKKFKIKKITAWYTKSFIHNGSHVINLLQFWFGKVIKITRYNKKKSSNINNDYLVSFTNQTAYIIQAFADDFEYFSIEMIGKYGRIRYDHGGENITINNKKKDFILKNNFVLNQKKQIIKNNLNKNQANVVDQIKKYLQNKKYFLCDGNSAFKTNKIICLK